MKTPLPSPLANVELATNPEPRCAAVIIADRSESMDGQPIAEVNAGLKAFKHGLLADALACLRVEVALVTFDGDVTVDVDFASPQNFEPPTLEAGGCTSLGEAIIKGLDLLDTRVAAYKAGGIPYYRPWAVLITDGVATDDVTEAGQRVREAEGRKRVAFFGVGVVGADMTKLAALSRRTPQRLEGLRFKDFFEWLSASVASVAASRPGDQVPLPPPDWASV